MNTTDQKPERVYLDYAAATPLLPEVLAAMKPYLEGNFANPSAIHKEGMEARLAVEAARSQVATAIQARPEQVTFTGGGTEGNNLAIFGLIEQLRTTGQEYSDMEVLTTKIEHPSIGVAMLRLKTLGVKVAYIPVDEFGQIILTELKSRITSETILVSFSYANSEIGTIQQLKKINKTVQAAEQTFGSKIYIHVDAAQAPLWLTCQFGTVAADMLVLDAAKCGGPKGVGMLIKSRRVELSAVTYGGGQEAGLRPGTENVPGIVGAGVALALAQANWREQAEQVAHIRDVAIEYILDNVPGAILNGPIGSARLANNINISIPGLDTEYAAVVLDSKGFAVSTKSACAGAGGGESVVVKETSNDPTRAASTLRISLGPDTTFEQLKALVGELKTHIEKMKNFL